MGSLDWDGNRDVLFNELFIVIFTINIFMIFKINFYDLLNLRAQKYL